MTELDSRLMHKREHRCDVWELNDLVTDLLCNTRDAVRT